MRQDVKIKSAEVIVTNQKSAQTATEQVVAHLEKILEDAPEIHDHADQVKTSKDEDSGRYEAACEAACEADCEAERGRQEDG
jgi:hypothetical protein